MSLDNPFKTAINELTDVEVAKARFVVRTLFFFITAVGRFIKAGKVTDAELDRAEDTAKRVMTRIEEMKE